MEGGRDNARNFHVVDLSNVLMQSKDNHRLAVLALSIEQQLLIAANKVRYVASQGQ